MDNFTAQALRTIKNHQMLQNGDTVIVACSGGADSVALLHFFCQNAQALGVALRAAHVNHALRESAARDEAFVAALCQKWDVPLDTAQLTPPAHASEAWAREQRYAFFERLCAQYKAKLATAHTQNDNAETVLLHLARGAGLHGAGGIPPVRGAVVRPLLEITRAQVEAYDAHCGLAFVTDETNASAQYTRNRMRHAALPALEQAHAGATAALARFAQNAREASAYLDDAARQLLQQSAVRDWRETAPAYDAPQLAAAHAAVRKAALRLLIEPVADPTQACVELADAALTAGGAVSLGRDARFCVTQGLVRMEMAFDETAWSCPAFAEGMRDFPNGYTVCVRRATYEEFINFQKDGKTPFKSYVDYGKIGNSTFFRTRRAGDVFRPVRRGVTKTLKKWYAEARLSARARATLPVLAQDGEVVWTAAFGTAEAALPSAGSAHIISITWRNQDGTSAR